MVELVSVIRSRILQSKLLSLNFRANEISTGLQAVEALMFV